MPTRAGSPIPGARARRRMGAPGRVDLRPGVVADERLRGRSRAFREVAALAPQRELNAGGLLLGGAAEQACRRPRVGRAAASAAARSTRKLLRPAGARDPGHGHPACRPTASLAIRRSTICPTSAARSSSSRIGERALAEEMLRHQARIGTAVRASRADRVGQAARPGRRAILARQQRPAGRAFRCRRPLSQPALDAR